MAATWAMRGFASSRILQRSMAAEGAAAAAIARIS
jgi:hypothetical protein